MDMLEVNTHRNVTEKLKQKVIAGMSDGASDMHAHYPTLMTVGSRCMTILELGVRDIKSTWGLLAGLSQESFGTAILKSPHELEFMSHRKLISVDIEDPAIHGANIQEVYELAEENNVHFEFHKSDTLTLELEDDSFDAIFFDTDHTYEQLSAELKKWGPKARTWMMFHDVARFGKVLIPAINEFLADNPDWIIIPNMSTNECMGFLTIARTSSQQWEQLSGRKFSDLVNKPI